MDPKLAIQKNVLWVARPDMAHTSMECLQVCRSRAKATVARQRSWPQGVSGLALCTVSTEHHCVGRDAEASLARERSRPKGLAGWAYYGAGAVYGGALGLGYGLNLVSRRS